MKIFPYILLLVACICVLLLRRKVTKEGRRVCDFLLCAVLIIFGGFRYEVGTDYHSYEVYFSTFNGLGRYMDIEWGYYLLVRLCGMIGGTAQLVFLIYSWLTVYFVYLFIREFSVNEELSWLVFLCIPLYYTSSFNAVRQWLAVAVFLYSLKYLELGNFKKYAILNIFGALSHKSALILIPMYFIFRIRKITFGKSIGLIAIYLICDKLGLINLLAVLFHKTSYTTENHYSTVLGPGWYIFTGLSLLCAFAMRYTTAEQKKENWLLINMNYICFIVVLLAILCSNNMLFTRMALYFLPVYIILIPKLIRVLRVHSPGFKTLMTLGTVCLVIVYYIGSVSHDSWLVPYEMNFRLFGR